MGRMKDYRQLIKELPSNTFVCALGEFNPPTTSHELLVKTVKVVAEQRKADHAIYTSQCDLISEEKKSQFLQLMFPKTKFQSLGESFFASTIKQLTEKYRKVVIVAGADQFAEFKKLKESVNVEIISIGDKDPDAENAKMRQFATKGIYEEFKKLLPSTIRDIDGKRLMNEMRVGMQLEPIKEQIVFVKDKLREKYFKGEIFKEGDIVESNDKQYTIVKRGSNHLLLKEETGELVSKWIHDVKPVKQTMKLEEAVIQQNGTDKIDVNAPESDTGAKKDPEPKGTKKGFLTFYGYSTKENGNAMQEEVSLAPSSNNPAQKAKAKAAMILKQAKEKEALKVKHQREQDSIKESILDKPTPSVEEIAKKHKVDVTEIEQQVKIGAKIEHEHSTAQKTAEEIARDHLSEKPDYYKKLKQYVEDVKEPTGDLKDACWKGYTAVGMKTKNGKKVPNCVPVNETKLNPNDPHGDYKEKSKVLHQLSLNKDVDQKDVQQRKMDLDKEYSTYKESLEEAKKKKVVSGSDVPAQLPAMSTTFDPFFKEEELNLTDDDINSMVESVTDEEIQDLYEENEVVLVYEDTGEEVEAHPEESKYDLMEVLSRQERLKGKIRLRKTAAKRGRSTKIALKRYSNPSTINKRARRLAIKLMKKRILRGRDPSKVSVGEKERIEKLMAKRKDIINRVAQKLVARVRKVEKSRMSHGKVTKGTMPSVF